MLRNSDRFAQGDCRRLQVGDVARFPLGRLGDAEQYRHGWELVAFCAGQSSFDSPGLAHCCVVRRMADGLTQTVAQHWFAQYQVEPRDISQRARKALAGKSRYVRPKQDRQPCALHFSPMITTNEPAEVLDPATI